MKRSLLLTTFLLLAAVSGCAPAKDGDASPRAELLPASPLAFAGQPDCNTPSHWDHDTLYLFHPFGPPWKTRRSFGPDLFHLETGPVTEFESSGFFPFIESTWKDPGGTLYGWYHTEFKICEKESLSAARIGAARSTDNGLNWQDLGITIMPPPDSLNCDSANSFFGGGNGDFSAIADGNQEWIYFFISTYHRPVGEQGVSVARMRYADRDDPVGKVQKWYQEAWAQPGLEGRVTPIFPVTGDWHQQTADAFWGPSIHYNTYLDEYVVLLNRTTGKDWTPEGFYISFNSDLSDPNGWSVPRALEAPRDATPLLFRPPSLVAQFDIPGNADWDDWGPWYPQVMGIDPEKRETDKKAGRVARLFIHGESRWEIHVARR